MIISSAEGEAMLHALQALPSVTQALRGCEILSLTECIGNFEIIKILCQLMSDAVALIEAAG